MSFVVYPYISSGFPALLRAERIRKPFLSRSVCNDAGKPLVCAPGFASSLGFGKPIAFLSAFS